MFIDRDDQDAFLYICFLLLEESIGKRDEAACVVDAAVQRELEREASPGIDFHLGCRVGTPSGGRGKEEGTKV